MAIAIEQAGREYSVRYTGYVIFLLMVVNVLNYVDRMALSVLMPSIKEELKLSDGQLGVLVGFGFSLFYAACGIPIARWADRGVRRNIIAIALAVWSVMTALSGVAQNFWQLMAARVGTGAGEAGCFPPAQSMLCDYVPMQQRSGAVAIHGLGTNLGIMLGMVSAGFLGEAIGWRWTFVALGLPGVVLAAIVMLTLREPIRGRFDPVTKQGTDVSLGQTIRFLWRSRTYRWLVLFQVSIGFYQYGMNQWLPSFYVRLFGFKLSSMGLYLGFALAIGSGLGLLIGGALASRLAERDVRLPLIIGVVSTAIAVPTAVAAVFASSAWVSIVLVSVTGLVASVALAPVIASVLSVVKQDMRATAIGMTILFQAILGFGLGPFCVGWLSDFLTPSLGTESLRYALLVPVCILPLAAGALFVATRVLKEDLQVPAVQN